MGDDGQEIVRGAQEYAATLEPSSRTSVRARILSLIERYRFGPGVVSARQLSPEELTRDSLLRGALHLHVDLMFRTSLSTEELLFTAARGWVFAATHSALEQFPVGVALALPAAERPVRRCDLFAEDSPRPDAAKALVVYSMATNPPRLGAGAALIRAMRAEARRFDPAPSVIAFSPLTGLRAKVIALVDDESAWEEHGRQSADLDAGLLREQLFSLLGQANMPEAIPEPARAWLCAQANRFVGCDGYRAGGFHRSMGASFVGLAPFGDSTDGESMWMRCYLEYPA